MDGITICKPILNKKKKEKYYGKCKEEKTEYYQKNKEQKSEYGRSYYKNISKEEKEIQKSMQ